MKFVLAISALIFAGCIAGTAVAQQDYHPLDDWRAIPENPQMREICMPQLTYATSIIAMIDRRAPIIDILRWEEGESEKAIGDRLGSDAFDMGIGSQMVMTKLINHARWDEQIYRHIPGGFPQWAFRSCLKGRDLP